MKCLGFFREFGGPDGPMVALVRETAAGDEERVVAYLRGGEVVLDVMELTPDVIDGSVLVESASLLTDGVWYWREDLPHYVAKYHLSIDANFLDEIASRDYATQRLSEGHLEIAAREVIADWSGEIG